MKDFLKVNEVMLYPNPRFLLLSRPKVEALYSEKQVKSLRAGHIRLIQASANLKMIYRLKTCTRVPHLNM
jgi:hypothetical protein